MSLEAKLELLTAAVIELTASIGAMQAPAAEVKIYPNALADGQTKKSAGKSAATEKASSSTAAATESEIPNDQPSSTDTTSGEQSAQTGESSSPALDYDKDVKTITFALSKAKGPETTKTILAWFDVASAKQLVVGQWADYIAACNEALK